jgi:uncharacterized protein YerC
VQVAMLLLLGETTYRKIAEHAGVAVGSISNIKKRLSSADCLQAVAVAVEPDKVAERDLRHKAKSIARVTPARRHGSR